MYGIKRKNPAPKDSLGISKKFLSVPKSQKRLYTWDSFPTPLTGFKSVSPRALTAKTATSPARTTAASGSYAGMCSIGESTAVQNSAETVRPDIHHLAGILFSGVSVAAPGSSSVLPSLPYPTSGFSLFQGLGQGQAFVQPASTSGTLS